MWSEPQIERNPRYASEPPRTLNPENSSEPHQQRKPGQSSEPMVFKNPSPSSASEKYQMTQAEYNRYVLEILQEMWWAIDWSNDIARARINAQLKTLETMLPIGSRED